MLPILNVVKILTLMSAFLLALLVIGLLFNITPL